MIKTILLDMDGVLANFHLAAMRLFNDEEGYNNWPNNQWDIAEVLGVSESEFWNKVNDAGYRFWATLPDYEWSMWLWKQLQSFKCEVLICSSPSHDPGCMKGKMMWLQQNFGGSFNDYIFTGHKHLLSREGTILIDDRQSTVDRFNKDDGLTFGTGLLFPNIANIYGSCNQGIIETAILHPIAEMV